MCRRAFNKTIILLGLAGYEMIITNSGLRASLVIYALVKVNSRSPTSPNPGIAGWKPMCDIENCPGMLIR